MFAPEDIREDSRRNLAEEYGGEVAGVDEVDLEQIEPVPHEEGHVDGAMNGDPSCVEEAGENIVLSDDACVHMFTFCMWFSMNKSVHTERRDMKNPDFRPVGIFLHAWRRGGISSEAYEKHHDQTQVRQWYRPYSWPRGYIRRSSPAASSDSYW